MIPINAHAAAEKEIAYRCVLAPALVDFVKLSNATARAIDHDEVNGPCRDCDDPVSHAPVSIVTQPSHSQGVPRKHGNAEEEESGAAATCSRKLQPARCSREVAWAFDRQTLTHSLPRLLP